MEGYSDKFGSRDRRPRARLWPAGSDTEGDTVDNEY